MTSLFDLDFDFNFDNVYDVDVDVDDESCELKFDAEFEAEPCVNNRKRKRETLFQSNGVNWARYTNELLEEGYTVIPLLDTMSCSAILAEMEVDLKRAPDTPDFFKEGGFSSLSKDQVLSMGSYAALGSVSSFYMKSKRDLDTLIYEQLYRLLVPSLIKTISCVSKEKTYYFRQNFDRLLIRAPGQDRSSAKAKNDWHRDQVLDSTPYHYGGWLSLGGPNMQRFVCLPGSHLNFDQISPSTLSARSVTVYVPIGHVILYSSAILQNISKSTPYEKKTGLYRMFTGFSISESSDSVFPSFIEKQLECIQKQIPLLLPSGQKPRQIPSNYFGLHNKKIIEFSKLFPDCTKELWDICGEMILKIFAEPFKVPFYEPFSQDELTRVQYHCVEIK